VGFDRWATVISLAAATACASSTTSTNRDDGGDGRIDGGVRRDAAPGSDGGPGGLDAGPMRPDGGTCATGTLCEGFCVDVATDPRNCGGCSRSCVIPNATAACNAGTCELGSCNTGFADCDGNLTNGCEIASDCTEGSACSTGCGSTGTTSCADACAPVCAPPAESCNTADDDCNGACDEGAIAGCRHGVHRSLGPGGHFYTTDATEAGSGGFTVERLDYYFLYTSDVGGLVPLFRCRKPSGNRFYTTSIDCEIGVAPESTMGFMAPDSRCGATQLYRLYRGTNDDHFYTTSAAERDNAVAMFGYVYESVAGWVWTAR
jgi:hypothetical protein